MDKPKPVIEYFIEHKNLQTNNFIAQSEGLSSINSVIFAPDETDANGNIIKGWKVTFDIVQNVVTSLHECRFLECRIFMRRQNSVSWSECIYVSRKIRLSVKSILRRLMEMEERLGKE